MVRSETEKKYSHVVICKLQKLEHEGPCNKTLLLLPTPSLLLCSCSSNILINGIRKLRKLPHVFDKVLELPISSNADVEVEENPEFFRFTVKMEQQQHGENLRNVRVQAVEIHPGITKIVMRKGVAKFGGSEVELLMLEQLKVDMWRFRLPPSTKPELATARFVDGELIVTVPKGVNGRGGYGGRDVLAGRKDIKLVLVK